MRSYKARAEQRVISEEPETVVARPPKEFDEWEEAATKVADAVVAAQLLALESSLNSQNKTRPITPDPFFEVSGVVDFSNTDIAPSWQDTHNFVLPDFGPLEDPKEISDTPQPQQRLSTIKNITKPNKIDNEKEPTSSVDTDEQHSKKLELILATATFFVAVAIVFVLLTRNQTSAKSNSTKVPSSHDIPAADTGALDAGPTNKPKP